MKYKLRLLYITVVKNRIVKILKGFLSLVILLSLVGLALLIGGQSVFKRYFAISNFNPQLSTFPGFFSSKSLTLSEQYNQNGTHRRDSTVVFLDNSATQYFQGREKVSQGGVPILLYHHVCNKHQKVTVSPAQFERQLEALYEANFRPIGLQEFLTFDLGLKPGQKPFILTFDDGWQNQFEAKHKDNMELMVSDSCAVGIMAEFNKKYPDFKMRGVFYLSLDKIPFGQKNIVAEKINYLMDLGFEIGHHTTGHDNLEMLPLKKFDRAIHHFMKEMEKEMGFRSFRVTSLAFPYGSIPSDQEKWEYLRNYSYDNLHNFVVFMSCQNKLCPLPGTEAFEALEGILPRITV
ncbi:polysaccharide deacetylase family protein, partial [bacterium]|nr:polysaccharide deacetylase family protein [bacterium]